MKKLVTSLMFALVVLLASIPTYAASSKIVVDGTPITSDVAAEIKNNRTMVPLRIISENLGVTVDWSNSIVTLTKNNKKVTLTTKSDKVVIDGVATKLDAKPYIKHNRVLVPLRFIAETFNSSIDYKNRVVTVNTTPLSIDGVKVKELLSETFMTMGGIVQSINGHANMEALYNLFEANKGQQVDAPENFTWRFIMAEKGWYLQFRQYAFMDEHDNSIKNYGLYSLMGSQEIKDAPATLLYDDDEDKWYIFDESALKTFWNIIDKATENGFVTEVSNTSA